VSVVRKTKEQLLDELRRKKTNRTLPEAEELLEAYGFTYRPGSKERGGIWNRGRWTLTLPKPHGGDRALAPRYIAKLIELIDLAEAEKQATREKDDDDG
jgi:hypothetical protein